MAALDAATGVKKSAFVPAKERTTISGTEAQETGNADEIQMGDDSDDDDE